MAGIEIIQRRDSLVLGRGDPLMAFFRPIVSGRDSEPGRHTPRVDATVVRCRSPQRIEAVALTRL
jgi:hypothetical protein